MRHLVNQAHFRSLASHIGRSPRSNTVADPPPDYANTDRHSPFVSAETRKLHQRLRLAANIQFRTGVLPPHEPQEVSQFFGADA